MSIRASGGGVVPPYAIGTKTAQTCARMRSTVVAKDNERRSTCARHFSFSACSQRSPSLRPRPQSPPSRWSAAVPVTAAEPAGRAVPRRRQRTPSGIPYIAYYRHYLVVNYCKVNGVITSLGIAAHGCDFQGTAVCSAGPAWQTGGGVGRGTPHSPGTPHMSVLSQEFRLRNERRQPHDRPGIDAALAHRDLGGRRCCLPHPRGVQLRDPQGVLTYRHGRGASPHDC